MSRRIDWRGPRIVIVAAVLAGALAVISGRQTWLTGSAAESALSTPGLVAAGTEAVPGLVALALIIVAAAVASATSGPVLRRVTLVIAAAAALLLAVLSVRAVSSAESILGAIAANATGRTGTVKVVDVEIAFWPYAAAAAALLSAIATGAGLTGAGRWRGLSERYDAPSGDTAGGRGQRVSTAWDDLERGIDPTEADPDAR